MPLPQGDDWDIQIQIWMDFFEMESAMFQSLHRISFSKKTSQLFDTWPLGCSEVLIFYSAGDWTQAHVHICQTDATPETQPQALDCLWSPRNVCTNCSPGEVFPLWLRQKWFVLLITTKASMTYFRKPWLGLCLLDPGRSVTIRSSILPFIFLHFPLLHMWHVRVCAYTCLHVCVWWWGR